MANFQVRQPQRSLVVQRLACIRLPQCAGVMVLLVQPCLRCLEADCRDPACIVYLVVRLELKNYRIFVVGCLSASITVGGI